LKEVLSRLSRRYELKLPTRVVMVDYDDRDGDLYIRFEQSEHSEGEPTEDGLAIVHYDGEQIAAVEVLDITKL